MINILASRSHACKPTPNKAIFTGMGFLYPHLSLCEGLPERMAICVWKQHTKGNYGCTGHFVVCFMSFQKIARLVLMPLCYRAYLWRPTGCRVHMLHKLHIFNTRNVHALLCHIFWMVKHPCQEKSKEHEPLGPGNCNSDTSVTFCRHFQEEIDAFPTDTGASTFI